MSCRISFANRLLHLLASLIVLLGSSATGQETETSKLELTFLVNEGFLINSGEKTVIVDAFLQTEYYGYGAVPDELMQAMLSGKAPFDQVDVALTSHVHLDHFQVEPAIEFLKSNESCKLISTEQVIVKARQSDTESAVAAQLMSVWPDAGKRSQIEHGDIKITAFRLSHANARHAGIQNLGLIIQMGDYKVLHVGDAAATKDNFAEYDLAKADIDCAILPAWFFQHQDLLKNHIGARHYIAAHLATSQYQQTSKLFAEKHPDVFVPTEPMEKWTLPEDGNN